MRPLPALLLSLIACACPAADDDATLLERFATLPRTVYADDGQERPRIVDSAFHLRGQRTFLIGGMVFATMHNFRHDRRWVTGDHPAYRGDLSSLGLDSIETAIPTRPAARAMGLPDASWWETDAGEWGEFLARAKGLPLVGDFSLIGLAGHRFSVQTVRDSKRFPASATLTTSHPFSGFDIFDPVGRRMYEAYFRTGVEAALSRRLNVWCWELWNEPGVLEPSQRWAEPFFAAWLERRHGSIAAANRAWGAAFPDFASAARTASQERKGPYADYLLFLGDSVGLFLDTMKMVVRSMDRRPDVAFAVQPHIATAIHTGHEGLDIWKVASRMEVCATEGGFGFGSAKPAEHGASVLDAVMGGGWLDDLFQYDVYAGLAAAHRVPLADHEFYLARRLGGKDRRVPCRADDFTTAYWTMAVHGFDAVQHYVFNGDAHAWGTTAEAAAESGRAGYLNYQLLNPANLDPEALVAGNARFRREFAALHPFLDRSRRRTGSVALLYSLPSKRVLGVYREGYRNNDFSRRMASAYAALAAAQYPVDVVFEEELAERGAAALGGYRALVAPCSTHSLPTTTPALAAFAAAGGTVVGSADGFARDLYGQPLAAPLAAGSGIHLPPPARDATAAHAVVAALEAARVPRP
ncbi:MAG: hypothetical protein L6R48_24040, partial [Planctomycetes bacterium]|nr:hypothetical protein [Planctomycetota bacterium]